MKTRSNIFIIVLGCLFLFVSCENALDKYPLNLPSTETFLENEEEIQMAIVGVHSPLYLMNDEVPFIIYFDNASDIAAERDVKPEPMYHNADAGQLLNIWDNMYKGIYRCNFILENIHRAEGRVSTDNLNRYKAQARTMRAYFYHILISMFGDVPLIEYPLTMEEAYVSRTPIDQVVDFILSECDDAANYLQQANEPNTMAITKGFAWAVKARTALYQERWNDAIAACNQIMALEGSEYQLEPDYGDITRLKGKTSPEVIWAIQYDQDNNTHLMPKRYLSRLGGGFCNKMPVQALVDSYECIDGLSIDKSPLYNPQDPWKNRDPRLHATIALPGTTFLGYQFETNTDSILCWNYNTEPATRIDNLDATHAYASFSGYCWRKYVDEGEYRTDGASSINAIAFRYAEVLLTYAEAKIESNQVDASVYEAINKVRQRAGMPVIEPGKDQQALREAVRKERKYELAGEGLRLFDIRRWKIAHKLMNGMCYGRVPNGYPSAAPVIDEYGNPDYSAFADKDRFGTKLGVRFFDPEIHYLSPIPNNERQANPNLSQNKGY